MTPAPIVFLDRRSQTLAKPDVLLRLLHYGPNSELAIFEPGDVVLNTNRKGRKQPKAALLGIGFDADDGQTRITRGGNFLVYGGSEDTHAVMRETVIKVNEQLDSRGRRLEDVAPSDLRKIFEDLSG